MLAVRALRDLTGMPLAEIRKELLVAGPERIRDYAGRLSGLQTSVYELGSNTPRPSVSSAADYLGELRRRTWASSASPVMSSSTAPPSRPLPQQGFEALEHRLSQSIREPARKARAEEWLRIPITPDVELTVRAPLEAEQRARLERCADLIRDILLGRGQ